jgi:hypothetical protein
MTVAYIIHMFEHAILRQPPPIRTVRSSTHITDMLPLHILCAFFSEWKAANTQLIPWPIRTSYKTNL